MSQIGLVLLVLLIGTGSGGLGEPVPDTARITLPELASSGGELVWPVRFALWGLAPLAEERAVELDELRLHMEVRGRARPLVFHIREAAEEGVVQTLQFDRGSALAGGRYTCCLRVVHLDGNDGRQQGLPLVSPPFVLLVPEGSGDNALSISVSVSAMIGMRRQSSSEQAASWCQPWPACSQSIVQLLRPPDEQSHDEAAEGEGEGEGEGDGGEQAAAEDTRHGDPGDEPGSSAYTLEQIIALPSSFPGSPKLVSAIVEQQYVAHDGFGEDSEEGWAPDFNVTVVLNPWHRPGLLKAQLAAIAQQSFAVSQVWMVLAASPKGHELKQEFEGTCRERALRCHVIESDYNFVYYMPWQAALQATTKYVWFLDDDVLPGADALRFLLHVTNTRPFRDSVLGGRGTCVWPGMLSDVEALVPAGKTYQHGCDYCRCVSLATMRESENLDGTRFMVQQHIKLLFREEPGNGLPNWYTPAGAQQGKWLSNDMQLTYAIRKYAKRRSYVLPCAGAPRLCVDGDSDRGAVGTTTVGERIVVRTDYIFRLFSRGSVQVWSERLRQHRPLAPLVFAHSQADAVLMVRLIACLEGEGVDTVHIAVAGHVGEPGASEEEMRELFGFSGFDRTNQRLGFFSLNIGHDFPRKPSPALTLADTVTHVTELLEAIAPPLLFLPARPALPQHAARPVCTGRDASVGGAGQAACGGGDSAEAHASVRGAQVAAEYLGIPVAWVHD
jgi:hypothetical protein